jgi:hypothetical protein
MSTLLNGPQKSFTVQEVDAWLCAAQEQMVSLYLHALQPGRPYALHQAFIAMTALFQESFEEVRVMSESTREWSQGVRSEAVDLRTHAAQLMERSAALLARMGQFAAPSPEAIREAESRMLAMFRDDPTQPSR